MIFQFDAIQIGTVEFTVPNKSLRVEAFLVSSKTGRTHGALKPHTGPWSPRTLQAVAALLESATADMLAFHCEGAVGPTSAGMVVVSEESEPPQDGDSSAPATFGGFFSKGGSLHGQCRSTAAV